MPQHHLNRAPGRAPLFSTLRWPVGLLPAPEMHRAGGRNARPWTLPGAWSSLAAMPSQGTEPFRSGDASPPAPLHPSREQDAG